MKSLILVSLVSMVATIGCKAGGELDDSGASGTGLSSVQIKLPEQVKGISMAELREAKSTGTERYFQEPVSSGGEGSVVSFSRDKVENENIKVGDKLYSPELLLYSGSTVVYRGYATGYRAKYFSIVSGENEINFKLECQDESLCPKGENLEIVDVTGSTSDPEKTPKILANIEVQSSGLTKEQKIDLVVQCRTNVVKKQCSTWASEFATGQKDCDSLYNTNRQDLESRSLDGGVYWGINDYIDACKRLGVIKSN